MAKRQVAVELNVAPVVENHTVEAIAMNTENPVVDAPVVDAPVVETPINERNFTTDEVQFLADIPDPQEYQPMMRTTFVMTPEEELSEESWDDIQTRLEVFNVEALKTTIGYCQDRIKELQKADVEALEAEMRAIQAKLLMMKGGKQFDLQSAKTPKTTTKVGRPIVNPNNQYDVYTGFGKYPDWLRELLEPANGDKDEERIIMNRLRADQAK